MAKNKSEIDENFLETPQEAPAAEIAGEDVNPGYKIITNLQPCPQHIPLSNGTGVGLGPKLAPNRTSAPILGKLLPKNFIKRLEHEKKIRVEG